MKFKHYSLIGAVLFAASPALAAQGLPQMDQSTYASQLAWMAISFVLLFMLVSAFIAPRVGGVLRERENAINDAIAKAEELKAKASGTKGNFEAAGAEARAKAAESISKAVADAAKESADAMAKLNAELDAKATASRDRIQKAVAKASLEVDDAAQALADAMAEKLLSNKPAVAKTTKKAS